MKKNCLDGLAYGKILRNVQHTFVGSRSTQSELAQHTNCKLSTNIYSTAWAQCPFMLWAQISVTVNKKDGYFQV